MSAAPGGPGGLAERGGGEAGHSTSTTPAAKSALRTCSCGMQSLSASRSRGQTKPPPPEPPKPELVEQLPPTPVQPDPVVAAPPKVEPKPEPKPAKPQPVREVKQPTKKPPAPRTTAPPKAERAGPETQSTATGASAAAARANYASMLNAHLARFKQALGSNDVGIAYLQFTVSRNGRLTARGLSRSSGSAVIDRAALDLLNRAQPLPPFPADMPESSKGFSVPIRYR